MGQKLKMKKNIQLMYDFKKRKIKTVKKPP